MNPKKSYLTVSTPKLEARIQRRRELLARETDGFRHMIRSLFLAEDERELATRRAEQGLTSAGGVA